MDLVTGTVRIADPNSRGTGVDLARLNPGSRKSHTNPMTSTPPAAHALDRYQPLNDEGEGANRKSSIFQRPRWLSNRPVEDDTCSVASSTSPSLAMPGSLPPKQGSLTHEGHLYKKGDGGALGTGNIFRRRYFVLKDGRLFYYKTWEDYGSGGKA